jgi:hypothetical protein
VYRRFDSTLSRARYLRLLSQSLDWRLGCALMREPDRVDRLSRPTNSRVASVSTASFVSVFWPWYAACVYENCENQRDERWKDEY